MKHTIKRTLALFIALLLATPTFAFAEAPEDQAIVIDDVSDAVDQELSIESLDIEPPAEEEGDFLLGDPDGTDDQDPDICEGSTLDPGELTGDEPNAALSSPFEQSVDVGDATFTVTAGAGVFPDGAKLRVTAEARDEVARGVEAALGAQGVYTHRLYRVEVLDASDNIFMPGVEQGTPVLRVKGLNLPEDARVIMHDEAQDLLFDVDAIIKADENVIEFSLYDMTVYDILSIEPAPVEEESAEAPDGESGDGEGEPAGETSSVSPDGEPASPEGKPVGDDDAQEPSPDGEGAERSEAEEVPDGQTSADADASDGAESSDEETSSVSPDGEPASPEGKPVDEQSADGEGEGEPVEQPADGAEPSGEETSSVSPDGEPASPEGKPVDEQSADGEGEADEQPADGEGEADEQPADGESKADEQTANGQEGEPVDEQPADGESKADEQTADGEGDGEPASPEGEPVDEQPTDEEEAIQPVRVVFDTVPETAVVTVWPIANGSLPEGAGSPEGETEGIGSLPEGAGSPEGETEGIGSLPEGAGSPEGETEGVVPPAPGPIPAQEDGSFLLFPGEYTYTAGAEGYISAENIPFTVADEPLTLSVALEAVEAEPVAFEQSRTVSGVVVTVQADPGVFPADAELSVKRVPVYKQRQADAAIEDVRDEDQNVAVSYTFDIKVIDPNTKEELQPADGQSVSVSFALEEASDENLEANVYHITDEGGDLTAEKLESDVDGEAVAATTDGFSLYTVEFTYNTLQYVLEGGGSVPLAEILESVGLTGEVEAVAVSDASLFDAVLKDGTWVVESYRAFDSEEWMKVTINAQAYEITVTDDQTPIPYLDENGATQDCTNYTAVTDQVAWGTSSAETWYAVTADTTIDDRVTVTGNVNLILCDGATLTAKSGITVTEGNSLTVYGQSKGTGALIAGESCLDYCAGIGGINEDSKHNAGKITVNGGTVTANGGKFGAGIGGGNGKGGDGKGGDGGTITINRGTVTATGGLNGAGIGGSRGGAGGTILINGGTVTANGRASAGIGGGEGGEGGNITISGGTVTANGGEYGAGIGGGDGGAGGTIQITGGTVEANGGKFGAGIGGGAGGGAGGTIQITGGTVEANGGKFGAGIGGGAGGGAGGNITISGGEVTANGGEYGAGIGGGAGGGAGGNITISGGTVTATGDYSGAGIGGGDGGAGTSDNDNITISGGKVTATGGSNGAGIGGGKGGEGGTINISGGEVEATGKDGGAGIGGGKGGEGGTINISGGEVEATGKDGGAGIGGGNWGAGGTINITGGEVTANGGEWGAGIGGGLEGEGGNLELGYTETSKTSMRVKASSYKYSYVKIDNGQPFIAEDGTTVITQSNLTSADGKWIFPKVDGTVIVDYVDANNKPMGKRACVEVTYQTITWGTEGKTTWYAVNKDQDFGYDRIIVTGHVNLILCDGETLEVPCGITVSEGNSLTVWAQSTGTNKGELIAGKMRDAVTCRSGCAGIGGVKDEAGGNITINGGDITAAGGDGQGGAGIGGGDSKPGGNITISGGKVTATGNGGGAGIGGGNGGAGGTIQINGGKVTATGDGYGAGIGGGMGGKGGNITISDGEVTATGGKDGVGIGGGGGDEITISGGEVTANGGKNGAGIGAIGDGGNITINGGKVTAIGGDGGAGIGSGKDGVGGTVVINGGEVEATGNGGGAGIGAGIGGSNGTLRLDLSNAEADAFLKASSYGCTVNVESASGKPVYVTDGSRFYTGELTEVEKDKVANTELKKAAPTSWQKLQTAIHKADTDTTTIKVSDYAVNGSVTAEDGDEALVIAAGQNITLDLDGCTLDRNLTTPADNGNVITVKGTLTLTDSSTAKTGTITGGNNNGDGGGVYVDGGTFNLSGGTISGNNTTYGGGGVYVDGGAFTMTGGTIGGTTANTAQYGGGVYVNGGTFNLSGGTIGSTKANTAQYGGGVYVNGGTFTMSGGTIGGTTANTASFGGGVYVANRGTFEMKMGTISSNTATKGGGVYVTDYKSTFTMSGGTIGGTTANTASFGGGVYVDTSGTFNLSGGTISRNTASRGNGGGVYVESGEFNLSGGKISGNTADCNGGGVCVFGGTFNLSGAPQISGNKAGATVTGSGLDGSTDNNVYLTDGKAITVDAALTEGASIGVSMETPGVFTKGNAGFTGVTARKFFTSDDAGYAVSVYGGQATLAVAETISTGNVKVINGYVTIGEAFDACNNANGDTLRLLTDVTTDSTLQTSGRNIILDLNGYGIRMKGEGSVINVPDGAVNLTLTDSDPTRTHYITLNDDGRGTAVSDEEPTSGEYVKVTGGYITGGNVTGSGGGVFVDNTFTMTGGTIIGNVATASGGGVYTNGGTFVMKDGSITDNKSKDHGGGVYVSLSTFTMEGGTISGNAATDKGACGGGVYMYGGTFTMNDGTISGNATVANGGGVHVFSQGTFTMNGGKITGNAANTAGGGVYVNKTSTFNISGAPEITGNKIGQDAANNVYLLTGKKINVTGKLTNGASVGVTTQAKPEEAGLVTLTGGLKDNGDLSAFTSDDGKYTIGWNDAGTEAVLGLIVAVTAKGWEGTYDGAAHGIAVTPAVSGATVEYSTDGASWSRNNPTFVDVCDQTVNWRVTATDYLPASGSAKVKITHRTATVTADAKGKTYGNADPALTAKVTGLASGDKASVIRYTLSRASGENAGTYTITPKGEATQGNYAVTYKTAKLTINRAAATVTADAKSKTYGDADPALTATVTGLASGDKASVIRCTLSRASGQNVGSYAITPKGEATQGNYTVTYKNAKLTIGKAAVTVTADAKTKAEGTADPALSYTATGLVNGDALTGALARDPGEAPGTYSINQGTLKAGDNYDLTFNGATLTIKAKSSVPVKPDYTLLARLKATGRNKLILSWSKVKDADGYDVFFARCVKGSTFRKIASVNAPARTCEISGLKNHKAYKANVKAWKRVNGRKTYIGEASPDVHAATGGYNKKRCNAMAVTVKNKEIALAKGKSSTIKASVTGVKKGKTVFRHAKLLRYYSSNANVAKVDDSGKITAVGSGACKIYVMANNGVKASVTVTVVTEPTKVAFKKATYSVKKGKKLNLAKQVKLSPSGVTSTLTWSSSAPTVATVDSKGVVKGVKKGTVTITVTTANGKTAKTKVSVG